MSVRRGWLKITPEDGALPDRETTRGLAGKPALVRGLWLLLQTMHNEPAR